MRILLLGALLALPAAAAEVRDRDDCKQAPRSVLLQTGLHIDVVYCTATPQIATTVDFQTPDSAGKFYQLTAHKIQRYEEDSAALVLVYEPNADWAIPAKDLDSLGAKVLAQGSLDNADHTGWVMQKDFRLNHQGLDWLEARQIVMHKAAERQWVYYRIIRDTRHNLLYLLYQRDDSGGASGEDRFFQSFTVNPDSFAAHATPGAHLPAPYPNP
jgi:hypothetical protein